MRILYVSCRKRNTVFVGNRLDYVFFSEPLKNRHSVFKKYGMRHFVNTNNVFHTIFTYSKIRYTFYDPINKKLGFFKFCPSDACRTVVGYFDACSGLS